jgi:hypothetical protein
MEETMLADLSRIPSNDLRSRLGALLSEERKAVVDFLLHLAELERRRLYAELGYATLFDYCTHELGLLKASAYRRVTGARLLKRFPQIEHYLRDGRLCLTLLKDVLNAENVEQVLEAASRRSKEEVEGLVVKLKPELASMSIPDRARPLGGGKYRLELTVGAEFMKELTEVRAALSHKHPKGELEAVIREGFALVLKQFRARRGIGAKPSTAKGAPQKDDNGKGGGAAEGLAAEVGQGESEAGRVEQGASVLGSEQRESEHRSHIPLPIQRQIWERDQGRCTHLRHDGSRCSSTFQVELDHIALAGFGGSDAPDNLRLRCRAHNQRWLEQLTVMEVSP